MLYSVVRDSQVSFRLFVTPNFSCHVICMTHVLLPRELFLFLFVCQCLSDSCIPTWEAICPLSLLHDNHICIFVIFFPANPVCTFISRNVADIKWLWHPKFNHSFRSVFRSCFQWRGHHNHSQRLSHTNEWHECHSSFFSSSLQFLLNRHWWWHQYFSSPTLYVTTLYDHPLLYTWWSRTGIMSGEKSLCQRPRLCFLTLFLGRCCSYSRQGNKTLCVIPSSCLISMLISMLISTAGKREKSRKLWSFFFGVTWFVHPFFVVEQEEVMSDLGFMLFLCFSLEE